MKLMKAMLRVFHRNEAAQAKNVRREKVEYYDNYMLLGSILGDYCGMLKLGDRRK